MTAPACIGCRHFFRSLSGRGTYCNRPLAVRFDPVTGKAERALGNTPENERWGRYTLFHTRKKCGPHGQFFEQRPDLGPQPGQLK